MMKQRAISVDVLRGIAILGMILSGSIAYGDVLPAWMYHAQVPPPLHQFNPALPGITWVDLVFPFFLFTMGAAMPLALKSRLEAGAGWTMFVALAIKRFLRLAFFALFTQHMKAWVLSATPTAEHYLLSMLAFVLLFFQFYRPKDLSPTWTKVFTVLKGISYIAAILILYFLPFKDGNGFDERKSDIILMVLANMAFAGTIIYGLTYNKPLLRLGLLPFITAVFFAGKESGDSWTKSIYTFSHIGRLDISWLYQFYFLKYLFIVIPGMFAGEWLLQSSPQIVNDKQLGKNNNGSIAWLTIAIMLVNLYGLFTRQLVLNTLLTAILCSVQLWLCNRESVEFKRYFKPMLNAGVYLLLLGLFFEAYEGGIKKDSSTYSYYFVCSGLAFLLVASIQLFARKKPSVAMKWLGANGQNPMVAYVAGALLLTPVLHLTGIQMWLDALHTSAIAGFLKGVIYTGIVCIITVLFTRKKWYWRT
jgi:predicted acyltransferase